MTWSFLNTTFTLLLDFFAIFLYGSRIYIGLAGSSLLGLHQHCLVIVKTGGRDASLTGWAPTSLFISENEKTLPN